MSATPVGRVLPYGERALLVEVEPAALVPAVRDAIAALDGVREAVAGASTVLAVAEPASLASLAARLANLRVDTRATATPPREPVELRVDYAGPDLSEVADELGASVEDVIGWHSGGDYVVRFCGFAPGFAYLDGLDDRLRVPRRAEPRPSVPAGSVAIAGEFAGVYPRSSPGGWRLIGRTDAALWDLDREPPALLVPGTPVRFVPS